MEQKGEFTFFFFFFYLKVMLFYGHIIISLNILCLLFQWGKIFRTISYSWEEFLICHPSWSAVWRCLLLLPQQVWFIRHTPSRGPAQGRWEAANCVDTGTSVISGIVPLWRMLPSLGPARPNSWPQTTSNKAKATAQSDLLLHWVSSACCPHHDAQVSTNTCSTYLSIAVMPRDNQLERNNWHCDRNLQS
jgi:hypothetical protein